MNNIYFMEDTKGVYLKIEDLKDGLIGGLLSHFDSKNFAYREPIRYHDEILLNENDFLVHKLWVDGEIFPTIKYHIMMDGELLETTSKIIKDNLEKLIIEYVNVNNKLPFKVYYDKSFSNGSVQLKYEPTSDQSFAIKISKNDKEQDLNIYSNLPTNALNPISNELEVINDDIYPIRDSSLLRSVSNNESVILTDLVIKKINERKERFREHETTFYLLQCEEGYVSDGLKDGRKEKIERINIKLSEKTYKESCPKIGDIISTKGKISTHRKLGFIIQNIRKINIQK